MIMASKRTIGKDLHAALCGDTKLSIDLYVEVLADPEDALKASLDRDADADDALPCMLADDGNVAMLLIDWQGTIHRNDNALEKLRAMWRSSFEANCKTVVPIFSDHIHQRNLGVAGIKWIPHPEPPRGGSPFPNWISRLRAAIAWAQSPLRANDKRGSDR